MSPRLMLSDWPKWTLRPSLHPTGNGGRRVAAQEDGHQHDGRKHGQLHRQRGLEARLREDAAEHDRGEHEAEALRSEHEAVRARQVFLWDEVDREGVRTTSCRVAKTLCIRKKSMMVGRLASRFPAASGSSMVRKMPMVMIIPS